MKFSKHAIEIAVTARRARKQREARAERRATNSKSAPQRNGGALALGEDQEEVTLAICHELARTPFRPTPWAIHELRGMGLLSRELVATAEQFSELHLETEPVIASGSFTGGFGADNASSHRTMLRHLAIVERIEELYAIVARKIGAENLSAFAMAFAPSRPSLRDLMHASTRSVRELHALIETGLTKLWAVSPLAPNHEHIFQSVARVNELSRI